MNTQDNTLNEAYEKWLPLSENINYLVSNFGQVKSVRRNIILKPYKSKQGYLVVNIDNRKIRTIHRLVAIHFILNPNKYKLVKHLDNNKQNNHYKNLAWDTHKGNTMDAWRDGLCIKVKRNGQLNGATNGKKSAIPILQLKYNMELVAEYESARDASRHTGFSNGSISHCLKGRSTNAHGFIWKYKI